MEQDIVARRVRELISRVSIAESRVHDLEIGLSRALSRIAELEAGKGRAPEADARPMFLRREAAR